jgi:hypothetical protein
MRTTLKDLIDAGLIQPGRRVLTIKYKSNTTHIDLMNDGKLMWNDECFNTPSHFSLRYKRIFTPGLRSDNGLSSITYEGLPLNTYFNRLNDNHGTPPASQRRITVNRNVHRTRHEPIDTFDQMRMVGVVVSDGNQERVIRT